MQSSNTEPDTASYSFGDRRGKSDLAKFSLDLSWAKEASDSARSRAYPSPPMSGSPPPPPRHNPESSNHPLSGYRSSGQDVYQTPQTPHAQQGESSVPPARPYQAEPPAQASYMPFRLDMPAGQLFYQPQPFMTPQSYPLHPPPGPSFQSTEGTPIREGSDYNSPKNQRKTKGHVASACVPCKKAHLRCDAQRPCSRCISNGKEDTCIDVQHKKRGRPRLRDEREGSRYDSAGPGYAQPPPEASMRRPISYYGAGDTPVSTPFGDSLQRAGSYRVLKSQGHSGGPAPIAPQYMEQAMQSANVYGPIQPAIRVLPSQESICAYLNMDMQVTKTTQSFNEILGASSLMSRKLQDIVISQDVEKVQRLQRSFEEERREKEPNYLPPIYLKFEEDRIIQAVGFGPEELNQVRLDKQETLTFQVAGAQPRVFQVRLGLGKKESTYFVAVIIISPPPQQQYPAPTSYPREAYPRDQHYAYQPQQPYMQAGPSHYAQSPPGYGGMGAYQPQGPLGSNVGPPQYAQPPRQEYAQQLPQYQAPPSQQYHAPPTQPQYQPSPHQTPYQRPQSQPQYQSSPSDMHSSQGSLTRDLQLPPIRDPHGGESSTDPRRRDDRTSRVDIGGLIEKPDALRRGT